MAFKVVKKANEKKAIKRNLLEFCSLKKKKGLDSLGLLQVILEEKNLVRYSLVPTQTFKIILTHEAYSENPQSYQTNGNMSGGKNQWRMKRHVDLSPRVSQSSNCLAHPSESGVIMKAIV